MDSLRSLTVGNVITFYLLRIHLVIKTHKQHGVLGLSLKPEADGWFVFMFYEFL